MSVHYSKFDLNTYKGTHYFRAHVPADYPLEETLQKCRAFRRLPPRLRELAALAKEWCCKQSPFPAGIEDIELWYDAEGHELNPYTGKLLTDKDIDAEWDQYPNAAEVRKFKVKDIPLPAGGFADPNTWEGQEPLPVALVNRDGITKEGLLVDIETRGREAAAAEYGVPKGWLAGIKNDAQLADMILDMDGKPWPDEEPADQDQSRNTMFPHALGKESALSTDVKGHEHRGKGPHGGEFTNHGNPDESTEGLGFDSKAYDIVKKHSADLAKRLTANEKGAIYDYTAGLNELTSEALRKGEVPADRDARDAIRHLDAVFARVPPLEKPVTTYRGLSFQDPGQAQKLAAQLDAHLGGKPLTLGDYQSTSLDPEQAGKFLVGHGQGKAGVLLEIEAGHGLGMEGLSAAKQASAEREFLLPRGGEYEVVGKGERMVGDRKVPVYRLRQRIKAAEG